MITRVIVCGGVDFTDRRLCFEQLDRILTQYENVEIVSGHARGADALGEEYAKSHSIPLKIFKAEWKMYGKAAGPIRNKAMLQYILEEQPAVVAFWNGRSCGTKNMIEQAEKAGVNVHVVMFQQ